MFCTTSGALPLLPSLVAIMLAVPVATELTTPAGETVATAMLSEAHVIARPVITFPLASFVVAVACVVCPGLSVLDARDTDTDATSAVETEPSITVSCALPVTDLCLAMIATFPGAFPLTTPELLTEAMLVSLVLHATGRVSCLPRRSSAVTVA